jgi:di- and tripeptidase
MFRLLGHQGSVLALLVVKEKGWLVSSSSAGDVRVSPFCSHAPGVHG